ncbi:MAG: glycoside hydrolase family 3 N-terminal domain-containing protein [Balneolaceae bacterium]
MNGFISINHTPLQPGLSALLLLITLFLVSCGSSESFYKTESEELPFLAEPQPGPVYTQKSDNFQIDSEAETDIDSILNSLTLREKIGQLFIVPVNGTFRNNRDRDYMRLKRLIVQNNIGGLIFMRGNIYDQAVITNKLQEISRIPLWITQDMEFGAAMRLSGTTRFTPAMGIAASAKRSNAYLKGKITAREAKALGVHQIFAPVLDVNNNPDNPVINVRSFSSDPEIVAEFGQYFIDGVQSEGIIATAKHFPGHGDTETDSHLALPTIQHDYSRIKSLELVPFRIAIDNGLTSVMSAHIAYPNISLETGIPGTLDESILNRILIDSLGFQGLIVTDGLDMKGITDFFSPGEAVVRSLKAGADLMLMSTDPSTAIDEVEQAVLRDEIDENRIDRSVRMMLELKKKNHLFESSETDITKLGYSINTPEYQAIAGRIARESVTLVNNNHEILPIREIDFPSVTVISVADDRSGSAGTFFAREIRKYHSSVSFHILDQRTGSEEITKMIDSAETADLVIIGSFIAVRSGHEIQLPSEHQSVLRQVTTQHNPSVLIAFGNPYVIRDIPDSEVQIMAWSGSNEQVRNTVPALFGASEIQGKLPISIPGMYDFAHGMYLNQTALRFDIPESAGMSTDSLLLVDDLMHNAIRDSVFPGGVVAAIKDGSLVWNQGYGYHDYTNTRKVKETDVYDLASLTKVLSTTLSVMKLIDEGKLKLKDPVSKFIPEFDTKEKRKITIEQMLLHISGLPAFNVYVDKLTTGDEILNAVKNEPLESEPGTKYVYSDLGFILLGDIVEQISGSRIDRYVRNNFYIPMGLSSTHFNPYRLGKWMNERIPPTEIDTVYGRGVVQAYAHDERAFFMDGVAGHAGLFSSSADVAKIAQMLLNKGVYAGRRYLSENIIEQFTSRQSPFNVRGYGFDRKSDDSSTAGAFTGMNTFGHLGFTGTSLWIDPDKNLAIILLTNRTFPYRSYGRTISNVRHEVANIISNAIIQK